LSGYVTQAYVDGYKRVDSYLFRCGSTQMLLKTNGSARELWGAMPFFTPITATHPIVWCQTWPWEARRVALIFLVCGKRRLLHKDVARLLAMTIYSTRNQEDWCVMIKGFSLLMGRFMK